MQIKCPQCGKKICKDEKHDLPNFPFCSKRCKLVDLGGWFDNRYKIVSPLENERNNNDD
ncbi:MAG: DNA gyrase inhibitor YacG [Candidatus Omnitrophica bacterium]|nr:DNA gyrase inhibitor YacG [Candidatus Omnitrophota bacterium]MBU1048327.1 DNA gyrase inhibitor YacG [Candidatus Omnitrophota bacterium]MBU1630964.1 DNA gyrase inhibitor YacG [Candidatus Omnitrophota bacterium]MBU1767448.1 DNA gyrase inhibitor YacG [Candidatus Omnitrophota bacterium]MBU1889691.1 DNA gyrase inhibitor YacG [Candidatus Omnitrophota bacterium]